MKNKNVRKRKALLLLPLLVIPFITLAFWAAGGGKGKTAQQADPMGLNMQLPEAHFKNDKDENKLSFYEEAEKDSEKFREEIKNDPLFQRAAPLDTALLHPNEPFVAGTEDYKDPNEEKVYAKLAELNRQLNAQTVKSDAGEPITTQDVAVNQEDSSQPDQLINRKRDSETDDPEMEQLNAMMDKILQIQHPEIVKEPFDPSALRQAQGMPKGDQHLFAVNGQTALASLSLLDTSGEKDTSVTGFYGLDEEVVSTTPNAIEAVIAENQTLVSGAVVKIRILNDITVGGIRIPRNNFVYGTGTLREERLAIDIHSVRYNQSLFPVNMEVYDMDGLPGIYIPGAVTRDVAKQSADNGLQGIDMTSLDPSLKAQAASAGIHAAKTLISKKAKLVRVFVKAGYKILLKNKAE